MSAALATPYEEQQLRDTIRAQARGFEIGPLGETVVPRAVILNYNLIPLTGASSGLKPIIYRANSLMDMYFFGTVVLGKNRLSRNPDKARNLHYIMCLIVMKDSLKEGIEIPRDHYKTTIYVEIFGIWRALPFGPREEDFFSNLGYSDLYIEWMRRTHSQDVRMLFVSETIKNAIKLGTRISNHYENNKLFRELFFDILPTEREIWSADSLHQRRTPAGAGHGEGTFDFIGVGAALQSRHYNVCVQDDLVGREARKSAVVMADTIDYHQVLVGATDNDPDNPARDFDEIVVGNRWSIDDLNGHIRREEPYFAWTTHSALGGCCPLHPFGQPIFPEAFTKEKLLRWKKRLGSYHFSCFAAGTPILMANLSEKNIEDLEVGDEIVGYTDSDYLTMQKATVQGTNVRKAHVFEFTLFSGRKVRCTHDHKFLKTSHRDRVSPYASIVELKELASVYTPPSDPTPMEQRDLDWLGGILDGEGSCGVSGQVVVSQSPEKNPEVHAAIGETLTRLGIPWTYVEQSNQFTVQGGKSLKVRLLKHAKMAKYQRFIDGWWAKPGRVMEDGGRDKIVNVSLLGEMDVYNIQSSSGNYVASGYATKNCQFLNFPIDPAKKKFNIADFRYYHFEKVTTTLGVPKEAPWQRVAELSFPQQHRWTIRHHVAEGDVEKDVFPKYLERHIITDPRHSNEAEASELGTGTRCRHAIVVVGVYDGSGEASSERPSYYYDTRSTSRRIYLLDQWAETCGTERYVKKILHFALKWKLTRVWCEAVASQKFLLYHFNYYVREETKKHPELAGIHMEPLKSSQNANAKYERIENVIPVVERHEVWLDANNCADFRDEAEKYGQSRTTVDLLDCFGYVMQVAPTRAESSEAVEEFLAAQRKRFISRLAAVG